VTLYDMNWRLEGKCRGMDPNIFFPVDGFGVLAAQQVCQGCPVADTCLDFALSTHQDHGVWGGKSERERRRIAHNLRLIFAS
jgi:WhiB family redox-sensing transcriptional regulator